MNDFSSSFCKEVLVYIDIPPNELLAFNISIGIELNNLIE